MHDKAFMFWRCILKKNKIMQLFVWLLRKECSEMKLTDTQKQKIRENREREEQLWITDKR